MNQVSTSTSPFSCKICGQKAHGNHFGVISCRACAAFFRRAACSKWSKMACRKGSCGQDSIICKPCRVKKCRDQGMDTTKFQYTDSFTVPGEFQLPQTLESYVGRPEFLLFCGSPSDSPSTSKVRIDVRYLLDEATRLLNQGPEMPYQADNQLKKLALGFRHIQLDAQNLQRCPKTGQLEIIAMWEYYFLTVTKWIMYFDEFHKLNRQLQMTLLQTIWHVWGKLHKLVATSAYRKMNLAALHSEYVYKNLILDLDNLEKDYSWMSDYPTDKVSKFLEAYVCVRWDPIQTLVALEPTDVEFTYMFAQLCFEYAGKRYQGDLLKVTEQFQEILANDMHEYYVNEMGRVRYFGRMAKMMKVNNVIQRYIFESRPKFEVARVFNVLKLEFSHPEMFEDSGFY